MLNFSLDSAAKDFCLRHHIFLTCILDVKSSMHSFDSYFSIILLCSLSQAVSKEHYLWWFLVQLYDLILIGISCLWSSSKGIQKKFWQVVILSCSCGVFMTSWFWIIVYLPYIIKYIYCCNSKMIGYVLL